MAEAASINCRRCGRDYQIAPRAFLPSCPHCGASPRALLGALKDNRVAATLAALALAVLAAALTMPFMEMTVMADRRDFSLIGGIRKLQNDGHGWIALILLIFSVIFPIAKLTALLIATSRLANISPKTRRILHKAADITGKYSLLDVLVVAVLIVIVKFKGVAEVEPRAGVYFFAAAVILSIFSGMCVKIENDEYRSANLESNRGMEPQINTDSHR